VRKTTLSNIVLLVIAAALAAFIAFTPEEAPQRVVLEPLSDEDPRAVSRIHLELSAGGTIELRRTEGSWDLVEPLAIAANDFRVSAWRLPKRAFCSMTQRSCLATPNRFTGGAISSTTATSRWWTMLTFPT